MWRPLLSRSQTIHTTHIQWWCLLKYNNHQTPISIYCDIHICSFVAISLDDYCIENQTAHSTVLSHKAWDFLYFLHALTMSYIINHKRFCFIGSHTASLIHMYFTIMYYMYVNIFTTCLQAP